MTTRTCASRSTVEASSTCYICLARSEQLAAEVRAAGARKSSRAESNQSRALPLISSTPTRQRRALGAPARQSRGPHRARLRGGVESPRLVRPSVFLARSARLARYAVAQRVQNSRVWPHNGLKQNRTSGASPG